MSKKTISHIALIYSVASILYYISIVIFCSITDYTTSAYSKPIVSTVIVIVSILFKFMMLFVVKKRIGIVVGISVIMTVMYNVYIGLLVGFVIVSICLAIAVITTIVYICFKRRNFNAIINMILPFLIISIFFGFITLISARPITHTTTTSFVNPSGNYMVEKCIIWSFDTPTSLDIQIRKNSEIRLMTFKLTPEPITFRSYYDYEINQEVINHDIQWIKDNRVSINGVLYDVSHYIDD